MDEDDAQWKEDFKVRFSSDFDRLVAFATNVSEMNKSRDPSPKRELEQPFHNDYHHRASGEYHHQHHQHHHNHHHHRTHIKKDESRKMKSEKSHERDYPADLTHSERRIRMMMEEQSRGNKQHYD